MVRFIHTSDWQLGMTRYFLDPGAQERFSQARFDCIRRIGELCREQDCRFVAVCGDVFESNQVGRKTVARALEALREIPVPVYLLPGNHDPLNDGSVYTGRAFVENKPDNVIVINDSQPLTAAEGVELIGAPWPAKRLADNPLHEVLDRMEPTRDGVRVVLAHGGVDAFAGFAEDESAAIIRLEAMRRALQEGKAHFFALGDKHSVTRIGGDDRIWYSGTPEATDFREPNPGHVNAVEVDGGSVRVETLQTGTWRFVEMTGDALSGPEDVARLAAEIDAVPDKRNVILRLTLAGSLDLGQISALSERLGHFGELFASFDVRQDELHSRIGDDDGTDGLTGFAAETASRLKKTVEQGGAEAVAARNALLLLARLAGKAGQAG